MTENLYFRRRRAIIFKFIAELKIAGCNTSESVLAISEEFLIMFPDITEYELVAMNSILRNRTLHDVETMFNEVTEIYCWITGCETEVVLNRQTEYRSDR